MPVGLEDGLILSEGLELGIPEGSEDGMTLSLGS